MQRKEQPIRREKVAKCKITKKREEKAFKKQIDRMVTSNKEIEDLYRSNDFDLARKGAPKYINDLVSPNIEKSLTTPNKSTEENNSALK